MRGEAKVGFPESDGLEPRPCIQGGKRKLRHGSTNQPGEISICTVKTTNENNSGERPTPTKQSRVSFEKICSATSNVIKLFMQILIRQWDQLLHGQLCACRDNQADWRSPRKRSARPRPTHHDLGNKLCNFQVCNFLVKQTPASMRETINFSESREVKQTWTQFIRENCT